MTKETQDLANTRREVLADSSGQDSRARFIQAIYKAEVKLAKARATVAGVEIELKSLKTSLRNSSR